MDHHTHTRTNSLTHPLGLAFALLTGALFGFLPVANLALASETHVGSATLILSNGDQSVEAVQLDADIELSVSGLLAEMTLTQTFRNSTSHWMDARYLFPLPPDASVRGLLLETDGRVIKGKIEPKEKARKVYEQARQQGQIAGMVEQQRPNLFTMNVATVAPGSTLKVTLDIMTPVSVSSQFHSITLPTTHTPRYTNAHTINPVALESAFTDTHHSRGPRLNLFASIESLNDHSRVFSQTHTLTSTPDQIQIINAPMDSDVTLSWPADYQAQASSAVFVTNDGGQRYAQLLLKPPATLPSETSTPRQLILVVDKSGSMAGDAMKAAKQALHFALDSMNEEDSFNIVAFDDQMQSLFANARPLSPDSLREARRFIDRLQADGGTEMDVALQFSLSQQSNNDLSEQGEAATPLRQIVFMTDGSVGYEEALLQRIKRTIGNNRLFTIGIGTAPNQWFLEKAAEAGRGLSLSIQNSQNVAESISALLSNLRYPVMTDVSVQYIGGHGELYPDPVPDLYADKPQLLMSKISQGVNQIVITGKRQGERFSETLELPATPAKEPVIASEKNTPTAAAMYWTRKKISSLSDEQRYSSDPDLHKSAILQLALNANLVTRYTSFVAVEQTPVRTETEGSVHHEVASLIPKGNTMMSVSAPQGAAGIDTLALLSLVFAISGCLFLFSSRYRLVLS